MKFVNQFLLGALMVIAIASCKKKEVVADVTFEFENYVDNQKIVKDGAINYTNAAGNKYNVSLLKYYISKISLIDADGNEVAFHDHDLIDAFGDARTSAMTVPCANYTQMKFTFGVDADHNTQGDQAGDLDPSYGMIWTWNTGYIFSKHEGKYMDGNNAEQNLSYHLGKQAMATEITVDLGGLNIEDKNQLATIKFNLNNMYNSPVIDFNLGDFRHSTANDQKWMDDMKANLNDVFSFTGSSDM